MTLDLSPQLTDLLRQRMATGLYGSEEEVIMAGLRLIADREEALAGIQRGIASMERGEGMPLDEAFAEIRRRNGLSDDT
jgi:antitoxin ParD1/3/4